mmetsp:Transcript_13006/g.32830  ORF Transcript_13006/g.32830 Transcript_13006/m.32830 type:complete len:651 (-) Transcript_13006:320-2272(-)|eukprot:CAMPEP_0116090772 /NCGR_PEP_ID=MMETSP0327-20121206/7147_1 /TAXON_ID=44447 /ORGANISM="Pseudo-nitzschia delicatissima, Strain B596" /LENGTH=650 /DNA_ID=CAMNT_0003582073 /DNA_START=227 /DNA_END=2179 /DNA_ORIENTATION=-
MDDEYMSGERSRQDEMAPRLLQRQQSGSDPNDSKWARSDTDLITRMMFELWGSKKQEENFPAEETSTALTTNIDKIVARELYEMNRAEREAIIEELHGVKSRAVIESNDMVQAALEAFREETDLLHQGKINEMDTDINGNKHPIGKAHLRAVEVLNSNYVTAPEFRIRFLRAEFFDVKKATLRYYRYLNHVWDLFGDVALVRQIELNDLNKKELKYLRGGQIQGLLSRDKMGRRIFAVFGIYDVPIRERTRVEAYLSFAAISDDETTQINGAVCLVFFSLNEKTSVRYDSIEHRIIRKFTNCAPVRYTAMHFCMPNEPVYKFFKTVVHALIQPQMRASTRFHIGSHMECNYALCQFGVPVDDIPKSITGTIKSKSIQKFMRARMAIEEYRRERCQLLGVRYVTKAMEDAMVAAATSFVPPSQEAVEQLKYLKGFPPSCPGTDCPKLNCIVFGDRVTYKHPPNVKFREYLRGKRHRQEELKEAERQQHGKEKRRKERIFSAEFLDEIIDEAFDILGFKFATYDKEAGWYTYIKPNTADNRQELRKKISQLMRDERKRERACMTLSSAGLGLATASEITSMDENPSEAGAKDDDAATMNNSHNYSGSDSDDAMPYSVMSSTMGKGAKRYKKNTRCTDNTEEACNDGCDFGFK